MLATWAGKAGIGMLRAVGRGATTAPGRVVLALDPGFIRAAAREARRARVLVTGTNGKTTTSALLEAAMVADGWTVVRNASGANMLAGIASAVAERVGPWGSMVADALVAEIDEATLPALTATLDADVAVVTNFFRDQLDRFGELDRTVGYVRRGLGAVRGTVCLNADDPLVADLARDLATDARPLMYGVEPTPENRLTGEEGLPPGLDTQFCPRCGERFEYTYRTYGHLGDYRCPGCGWSRPNRAVLGTQLPGEDAGLFLEISFPAGDPIRARLGVPGLYNAYNAVAAAAAAFAAGVDPRAIRAGLEGFAGAFGRMERLRVEDREVVLALSKNPVGFDQILRAVVDDPRAGSLLLGINDGIADGRDISWLWDVDFELLLEREDVPVVASGRRAEDMAVRLKYGDVAEDRIRVENDTMDGLEAAIAATPEGACAYALLTYTAMLDLRARLQRRGLVREMWRG